MSFKRQLAVSEDVFDWHSWEKGPWYKQRRKDQVAGEELAGLCRNLIVSALICVMDIIGVTYVVIVNIK